MKLRQALITSLLIPCVMLPSLATESTDGALRKGTNPLVEAMGRPVYANRVFQHGYHCWDPSMIKRGDTYHLFYSRWKTVPGQVNNLAHWMTTSEIVHATSKNLLGPYTNVENPALSAKDNHGWWLHNPKITPQYNSDGSIKRYVLYFINVKKGAIAGTSWLYSDDLTPGSWYGKRETFGKDAPFNNPAILFYPDGSAYGLSKSNDPAYPDTRRHLFAYRTKDVTAHPEDSKKRWGQPLPNNRGTLNQLPGDVDHEDACVWEVNGQYHAIMTDMSGRATGGKKKASMHWFTDAKSGTNYRLHSDVPLAHAGTPVEFDDGISRNYYRMERPNVYVNPETGAVEAFMLSCVPRESAQSAPTEGASILIWPVNSWRPCKTVRQEKDGTLTLTATDATLENGPNIEHKAESPNIGFWTKAEGTAEWRLDVKNPGRYAIVIHAAATGSGNKLAIVAGDERVEWTRHCTGGWDTFKDFNVGAINLDKGEVQLSLKSADGKAPFVNVMQLVLRPVSKAAKAKQPVGTQGRPNIVLVLADDLGWNSLGCMGSDYYESPNIDKLAEQGMIFDNGYAACPICAPTRASLMSGWEIPRHKVLRVSDGQQKKIKQGQRITTRLLQPPHQGYLDKEVVTLAEAFQSNGYRTGMFGKWHLGWWKNPDHLPPALGFTDFKMKTDYKHYGTGLVPSGVNDDERIPEGVYLTDYMCDLALEFMEDSAKRKQPFFLYLPDLLVHSPFETIKEELDYFEAKPTGTMHHDAPLAAMVKSLDRTVGRVMDKLKALGIDDNTLVVFTSDNGGVPLDVDGKWWREQKPNTSNGVLKGGKGGLFEGGVRVPYIFRFPGRIPAGTLSHEPITTIDLYPTLLVQAGLKPPADHKLDGADISACLADAQARLPQRALYWFYSNYSFAGRPGMAMREGDWKYAFFFENEEEELYNLAEDIGENENVVNAHPERAKLMRKKLDAWAADVNVPPHKPNPDYKLKK